jgi:hypothetical protein
VPATPEGWKPPRGPSVFIVAFVVYDVVLAFAPGLDQKINTYPISAFPMFATIRAREPLDIHQPYSVSGVHFEVEPAQADESDWLDYQYRTVVQTSPGELGKKLEAIYADARARYPQTTLVRAWLTIYETPAYPAPAHFVPHPIAIMGEYDGAFRSHWSRNLPAAVPGAVYYRDDIPEPHPMTDWKVPAGNPVYVVQPPWLLFVSRQRQ